MVRGAGVWQGGLHVRHPRSRPCDPQTNQPEEPENLSHETHHKIHQSIQTAATQPTRPVHQRGTTNQGIPPEKITPTQTRSQGKIR